MDDNDEGLIVFNIKMGSVRVRDSYLLIFIGVVFSVMLNLVLMEIEIGKYARLIIVSIFILLIIKIYFNSIKRIFFRNKDTIVFVGPLSETEIKLSDVARITISGARSNSFVGMEIKLKKKIVPRMFHFSAAQTNYGNYKDTKSGLVKYLTKYGGTIPISWHDI